jgi:hypothetical protein
MSVAVDIYVVRGLDEGEMCLLAHFMICDSGMASLF